MKLFNQSGKKDGRSLIIDPKYVIKGGVYQEHDQEKNKRLYFNPQAKIDVIDEYGVALLKMYPALLMRLDEQAEAPAKRKAVKGKVISSREAKKAVKKPKARRK